jgi:hypothetical protein
MMSRGAITRVTVALTAAFCTAAIAAPALAADAPPPAPKGKTPLTDLPPTGQPAAVQPAALSPLSSPVTVAPVEHPETHKAYVFIRGTDNFLYFLDVATKTWTKANVSGGLTSSPNVLVRHFDSGTYFFVVANGPGNHPRITSSRDLVTWSAWKNYSGLTATSATTYTADVGGTALFFRGADNALYGYGRGLVRIGGGLSSPPVVSWDPSADHKIVVTVRGTDGNLYRTTGAIDAGVPKFGGFERLSQAQVASAATRAGVSKRYYFRAPDSTLRYYHYSNKTVGTINTGRIDSTPAAIVEPGTFGEQPEQVWVFARGTDKHLYRYDAKSGTWTGFGGLVA